VAVDIVIKVQETRQILATRWGNIIWFLIWQQFVKLLQAVFIFTICWFESFVSISE